MLPDLSTSVIAARELLGWELHFQSPQGDVSGMIVETEAYGPDDPAAHSFKGQTKRNAAIFGPAGTIYIYFIYGMHYCVNIAAGKEGEGQAVLIRALEPISGLEIMKSNRNTTIETQLTNGPAKLVSALGISFNINNTMINTGALSLRPYQKPTNIVTRPRIGITKAADWPHRFYIADNHFVSRL